MSAIFWYKGLVFEHSSSLSSLSSFHYYYYPFIMIIISPLFLQTQRISSKAMTSYKTNGAWEFCEEFCDFISVLISLLLDSSSAFILDLMIIFELPCFFNNLSSGFTRFIGFYSKKRI
jgi:hypothetical protein